MVNRGGITFAFRAIEETGATPEQIARAFVVAREIFDLPGFVREVEASTTRSPPMCRPSSTSSSVASSTARSGGS